MTVLETNEQTKADYGKGDNAFVVGYHKQIIASRPSKDDLQVPIGSYHGTFEWDLH